MEIFNEATYQQIEDYLTGNLSEPAASAVRRRLEQEPAFASEVAFMKFLLEGRTVKKQMAVLHGFDQYYRRRRLKIRFVQATTAVAAMLGLVFLIDVLVRVPPVGETGHPKASSEADSIRQQPALHASPLDTGSQIQPLPASDSISQPIATTENAGKTKIEKAQPAKDLVAYLDSRDNLTTLSESDDPNLQEAYSLMDGGEQADALPWLEKYQENLPAAEEDFELRIETAKIYLREKKDFARAEFHLQKVIDNNPSDRFRAEAAFYLALRFILDKNRDAARPWLDKVIGLNLEPWKSQAEKLKN